MRADEGEEEAEEGEEEAEAEMEEEGRAARIPSAWRDNAERREKAIGFGFGIGVRGASGGGLGGRGSSERSGEEAKRSDSLSSKEGEGEGEGEGEVRREWRRLGLKDLLERCLSIDATKTLVVSARAREREGAVVME